MRRVAFTILLAALTLAGCSSGGSSTSRSSAGPGGGTTAGSSPTSVSAGQGCRADYPRRPLPAWASAGFTPPDQSMPYVLGDSGNIIGILWVDHDPLVVPPVKGRNNKILWVSRVSSGAGTPLRIRARLNGTGETATRTVDGGPGPSVVDLPSPGCWSMDLAWGDQHDHVQLEYVAG